MTITLTLGGREVALVWNASARFRIGTLGDVDRFTGLAYACAVLWAAGGCKFYRTPEDMAEAVEAAGLKPVNDAVEALLKPADPNAEKKSSLSSGPLPGSTSA